MNQLDQTGTYLKERDIKTERNRQQIGGCQRREVGWRKWVKVVKRYNKRKRSETKSRFVWMREEGKGKFWPRGSGQLCHVSEVGLPTGQDEGTE